MFGGDYNRVTATITHNGEVIHYLHGHWDSCFYLTDPSKKQESLFLDVTKLTVLPKKVLDVPYQGPYESRCLWNTVTQAIRRPEGPDWNTVQVNKTKLEDDQRKLPCQQKHDSPAYRPWTQKLFVKVPHQGVGKMDNGYRFKYFDLNAVSPNAPYRDFLALSRNVYDERGMPESMESVVTKYDCLFLR
ncbi:oxysterol-binding protein [Blastocystis sp. subtype 4]|uniref:oxysterol-binding protein n=1 Tax=Blastocystis sp. subtype 4 TaxID=944170 RepID=UPI0007122588|nr:oxysterol-binding protein [Blastocystis sp. subtype 4]KNB44740.1 oxysterol-binding protein [Blastocystis sp. subtype 4]|eukprot:XP_014528187.1 oxysterol-binding protein [Blastocystis sp. subtype 4]